MPEKFDIYSKIFYRDVEKFVRHLCLLVLPHQMRVSNYFINSFYSVGTKKSRVVVTACQSTWAGGPVHPYSNMVTKNVSYIDF